MSGRRRNATKLGGEAGGGDRRLEALELWGALGLGVLALGRWHGA